MIAMTRVWKATGIAFGMLLTVLMLTALAAGFVSCAGCATVFLSERLAFDVLNVSSVQVETKDAKGSGEVVLASAGKTLVLTAYHCVQSADFEETPIEVHHEGKHCLAQLVAADVQNDLALLDVGSCDLASAPIAIATKEPRPYERLRVVGNRWGFPGTPGDGLFVGRAEVPGHKDFLYQTTLPIFHGDSGGPVTNVYGELIGVVDCGPSYPAPVFLRDEDGEHKRMPAEALVPIPEVALIIGLPTIRAFLKPYGVVR